MLIPALSRMVVVIIINGGWNDVQNISCKLSDLQKLLITQKKKLTCTGGVCSGIYVRSLRELRFLKMYANKNSRKETMKYPLWLNEVIAK